MENVLVPITVGAGLVLVIDFVKKFFPNISKTGLKALTLVLAGLLSSLVLLAQNNNVLAQKIVENGLIILGSSQALFALVWKDTKIHQTLTAKQ